MNTQTTQKSLPIYRGELALLLAVAINSFGVVLMLYSGTGISAISSVPYAFSCVFPKISLGPGYRSLSTHIADKLEVLLICTDPAGNLRELIASLHTFLNSITVFLTVKEKFRSTNPSFRSAQLMKVIINPYDLLSAVWCSGLLAITECRVVIQMSSGI